MKPLSDIICIEGLNNPLSTKIDKLSGQLNEQYAMH